MFLLNKKRPHLCEFDVYKHIINFIKLFLSDVIPFSFDTKNHPLYIAHEGLLRTQCKALTNFTTDQEPNIKVSLFTCVYQGAFQCQQFYIFRVGGGSP